MLTDAKRERLTLLTEEAAEVIQAVSKILRHGYENVNPDATSTQIDNKRQLEKELTDFSAVCGMMLAQGDILPVDSDEKVAAVIRKLKYSKFQDQK